VRFLGREIVWDSMLRTGTQLLAFLLATTRAQSQGVSSILQVTIVDRIFRCTFNRKLPRGTLQLPTTAIALTTAVVGVGGGIYGIGGGSVLPSF
jgi:hypothetical protein